MIDAIIRGFEWGMIAATLSACAMCLTCAWFETRGRKEYEGE